MREDMFKVIVERPRRGRRHASKTKLRYDKCEDRSCVSGRRLAAEIGYRKHLNENLGPLKRFLHKQVGRKWNDVFSEICKNLDTGSTVKMHVREHIDDFVLRRVNRRGGKLYACDRQWGGEKLLVDCYTALYVDPDDGKIKQTDNLCKTLGIVPIRKRAKKLREARLAKPKTLIPVSGGRWHARLGGVWYLIEVCGLPTGLMGQWMMADTVLRAIETNTRTPTDTWTLVSTAQLSKKALQMHGLVNQVDRNGGYYG